MWEAAADAMHVISRNRDIRSQHWNRRRISAEKFGKFSQEKLYVQISQTGMVGKWHIAETPLKSDQREWLAHHVYHEDFADKACYPVNRGFDDFYGIVYVSGKNGPPTGKAQDGRYFLEFTEQLVEKILMVNEQLKSEQLWYTEDVNGRKGFRWLNVIFR